MMGNLSPDIIGTNPKYPKVVDHSWMAVDTASYDNIPTENNPVRVLPDLNEMWNHGQLPGISGMATSIIPLKDMALGMRTAEQDKEDSAASAVSIVREAKKSLMAGANAKELANHLRSLFTSRQIAASAEALKGVSKEMGLLGNVYIDVSAFTTFAEADKFLTNHRSKLARDILYDPTTMNPSVAQNLASKYRKNAVTEMVYDAELINRYKNHLVYAGRIPESSDIGSKEDLRAAFLYEKPAAPEQPKKAKAINKLSDAEVKAGLKTLAEEHAYENREAADAILLKTIEPILVFAQDSLSKGKDLNDLKGMLRQKYASTDLQQAAPYLALVISKPGLVASHLDGLVSEGKISDIFGEALKKIGRRYPIATSLIEDTERTPSVGVRANYRMFSPHAESSPYREAAFTALKQGIAPEKVLAKLATKISAEEAGRILADAIATLNSLPAGAVANKAKKSSSKVIIEEPVKKATLPDPSTIGPQIQEILSFFQGANTDIEINAPQKFEPLQIDMGITNAGIDEVLK